MEKELHFFDTMDPYLPDKPGRVMHLSIDYQILGERVNNNVECFMASSNVNNILAEMDYNQLTGHCEHFNTLAHALTTVEKL